MQKVASYADVLRLVTHSSPRTSVWEAMQKGHISVFGDFQFLQDRANFWQTDLF